MSRLFSDNVETLSLFMETAVAKPAAESLDPEAAAFVVVFCSKSNGWEKSKYPLTPGDCPVGSSLNFRSPSSLCPVWRQGQVCHRAQGRTVGSQLQKQRSGSRGSRWPRKVIKQGQANILELAVSRPFGNNPGRSRSTEVWTQGSHGGGGVPMKALSLTRCVSTGLRSFVLDLGRGPNGVPFIGWAP